MSFLRAHQRGLLSGPEGGGDMTTTTLFWGGVLLCIILAAVSTATDRGRR